MDNLRKFNDNKVTSISEQIIIIIITIVITTITTIIVVTEVSRSHVQARSESSGSVVVGLISRLARRHMWVKFVVLFSALGSFAPGTTLSPLLKNLHVIKFDLY